MKVKIETIIYGRLTLAGFQVRTEPPSHSPSSAEEWEKIRWKTLQVKIKPGILLTNYRHWQNRLGLGKISLMYFQLKIE